MRCVAIGTIGAFDGSAGFFERARTVGLSEKVTRYAQMSERSSDIRARICAGRADVSHQLSSGAMIVMILRVFEASVGSSDPHSRVGS